MLMRTVYCGALGFLLVTSSPAQISDTFDYQVTEVRDATEMITRIEHLRTGRVWQAADGRGLRQGAEYCPVYDNLSNPDGDPNGPPNFNWQDAAGAYTSRTCSLPLDPNALVFVAFFGLGPDACEALGEPTAPKSMDLCVTSAQDLHFDNYLMDSATTGLDPNQLHRIEKLDSTLWFLPEGEQAYDLELFVGTFELSDYDNSGLLEPVDGLLLTIAIDANTPGGVFTYELDLVDIFGPNTALLAYGRGLFGTSFADQRFARGSPSPIGLACRVGNAIAGGYPDDLLSGPDPNCDSPADFATAGTPTDPELGNFWRFYNSVDGPPDGPPPYDDCNFPIPDLDGDPNNVTIIEILNGGYGVNWVFFDGATNRDLAPDTPLRMSMLMDGCQPSCGPGCGPPGIDPDINNDCRVDLSDLAKVLADFGAIGPTPSPADVNGDTAVDLSDLAFVLSVFGVECPG